MVLDDSDWTAFSKHLMRKMGTFEGIAKSNGVESKVTHVVAYCASVSPPLKQIKPVSTKYLIEA